MQDKEEEEEEEGKEGGILIASTLDGRLHGIDPSSGGKILWSLQDSLGPMVAVTERTFGDSRKDSRQDVIINPLVPSSRTIGPQSGVGKKGIFIPELNGGAMGHLYYYEPGGNVKQLQIPLKDIINDHSVFINDDYVFTGKKLTHVLAINPKTGSVLQIYGEGMTSEPLVETETKKLPSNVIFVGRTQYYLNIWDKESSSLLWNITYGEFIPSNLKGKPQDGLQKGIVYEDKNGRVSLSLPGRKQQSLELDLKSPFVSAFQVDEKANSLAVYSPPKPSENTKELGYIEEVDGSLYMIPGGRSLLNNKNMKEIALFEPRLSCQEGEPGYPDCLIGMHKISGLLREPPSLSRKLLSLPAQLSLIIGLFGVLLFLFVKWPRKEEKGTKSKDIQTSEDFQETRPKILQVSTTVLGTGSHGTVVYKGTFEGREVAVKRLLVEFYQVADHEVKILQDSDYHPNVVRYFYKETTQGFTYVALELCPASLYDVIEKPETEELRLLRDQLDPKCAIQQILSGILHLHRLKIVHRDLKPQNILIADSRMTNKFVPRLLISDFGLGKRLEEEQSFFHVSHATAGGTQGWRAPECIAASHSLRPIDSLAPSLDTLLGHDHRITMAVDIFSAGCLMYYILSNGNHPFGDRMSRERNIVKNNMMLEKLDRLKDGVLARDLIKRMIAHSPSKRPDASKALSHPYFWTPSMQLAFLQDVSDRLEGEDKESSPILKALERKAAKVLVGTDWYSRLDPGLIETLGKYRKYDGASVQDLMRVIRNKVCFCGILPARRPLTDLTKKHHYAELPETVQATVGHLPEGYLAYFLNLFPSLLIHTYNIISEFSFITLEPIFRQYFEPQDS